MAKIFAFCRRRLVYDEYSIGFGAFLLNEIGSDRKIARLRR